MTSDTTPTIPPARGSRPGTTCSGATSCGPSPRARPRRRRRRHLNLDPIERRGAADCVGRLSVRRPPACSRARPRVARVEDNPWHPRCRPGVPRVRTRTRAGNERCVSRIPSAIPLNTYAYNVARVSVSQTRACRRFARPARRARGRTGTRRAAEHIDKAGFDGRACRPARPRIPWPARRA